MSGRAPRVLVDATAVPADRGGVGRYVDGLISALGAAGADFAVACQRADAERFGRMAPEATIVPGPAAIAHRPARLAWEQTGLPLVVQQVGADVLHSPHYTMPLRAGRPVVVTIHDATFFTQPDVHTSIKGPFFRSAIKTALHRAARCVVPRPRRPGTSWSGCWTRTRPGSTSPTTGWTGRSSTCRSDTERQLGAGAARPARHAVRGLPRHAGAAQERAVAGPRLGTGGAGPG